MGLQSRLLAGLAVLVFLAIASSGWVTLSVARGRMEAAESERARALGTAVAGTLGASFTTEATARRAAEALVGVGGIREVAVIDARQRSLAGDPSGDARLSAVLGGESLLARDGDGSVAVYAPIHGAGGQVVGALRLRLAVEETLRDAARGSSGLLAALTLFDGGLILLFGALFLRQVIRPLEALARASLRVAAGDLEGAPLPSEPGEIGTLIDSFNRMTAALAEQRSHLAASREQVLAQEKLATVGRLAAGVAHEIGNPLTAVLGYVDLMLLDERAPETRDLLGRVKVETGRIHRIVHDLLDYARPTEEAREPVRWAEVLSAAEGLLRPQPRFRDVALHNELPATLPPVSASARRLLQVLINLLLNAADALAGRGMVRVTGRAENDRVILEISDEGPGIDPAIGDRIFDPFLTTKSPGAGTGLGLAVCRSIVQAFGGTIELVAPAASHKIAASHTPPATPDAALHSVNAAPHSAPAVQRAGATFRVTLPSWKG